MKNPLVSIIIPTFNRAHLLGETLDSIRSQTYQNWECLVVDDGSTDSTTILMENYMRKDSRFQYYHRPKESLGGGNAARNYGFTLSKGEYIQWFDSDDRMLPDFLKKKVSLAGENKEVIITTGNKIELDGTISKIPLTLSNSLFGEYVMGTCQVLTPSAMFKTAFLKDKMLFHPALQRSQEAEFLSRIFYGLQKDLVALEDSITFEYRVTDDSKSLADIAYQSSFKRSHFLVHYNNLVRAIKLRDEKMCQLLYQKISRLMELSLYNEQLDDFEFYRFHLKKIVRRDKMLFLRLVYFSFKTLNKRSFRLMKTLRSLPLKLSWFHQITEEQAFYVGELE